MTPPVQVELLNSSAAGAQMDEQVRSPGHGSAIAVVVFGVGDQQHTELHRQIDSLEGGLQLLAYRPRWHS